MSSYIKNTHLLNKFIKLHYLISYKKKSKDSCTSHIILVIIVIYLLIVRLHNAIEKNITLIQACLIKGYILVAQLMLFVGFVKYV